MTKQNNIFATSFVLAILLLCTSSSRASEDLQRVLEVLENPPQAFNFEGTFIYLAGDKKEVLKISRIDDGDNFAERLTALTGNASQVIRTNRGVWYYFPEKNEGYFHHTHENSRFTQKSLVSNIDYLKKFYDLKYHGSSRVAGRLADHISFYSKDNYRYGCDLWLDSKTGLTLRSDLLTTEKSIIDSYMFVEVDFLNPVQEVEISPSLFGEDFVWEFDDIAYGGIEKSSTNWSVLRVPDGFRIVKSIRAKAGENDPYYEHLTVSDELTNVSVSIHRAEDINASSFVGFVQIGGVNVYGRMLNDYHIKVVGEAPLKTIQMIGDSISQSVVLN